MRVHIHETPGLEVNGQAYFQNTAHAHTVEGGWLNGTKTTIYHETGARALIQQGTSGSVLPMRLFIHDNSPMAAKTLDVGVFPPDSSKRNYSARTYSRFGPIPLPFFERRSARILRKADRRLARLAVEAESV